MSELVHGLNKFYKSSGSYVWNEDTCDLEITGGAHLKMYADDGTTYTPVKRDGVTYYWDAIYSNSSGNQFYIGIEKFDANKTGTSNDSCSYIVNTKAKYDHNRAFGTFTLVNDANGNPVKYIRVRVLNNWTGSVTGETCGNVAKIHFLSIREVTNNTLKTASITKKSEIKTDSFRTTEKNLPDTEVGGAHFYKNGFVGGTDFYEI